MFPYLCVLLAAPDFGCRIRSSEVSGHLLQIVQEREEAVFDVRHLETVKLSTGRQGSYLSYLVGKFCGAVLPWSLGSLKGLCDG